MSVRSALAVGALNAMLIPIWPATTRGAPPSKVHALTAHAQVAPVAPVAPRDERLPPRATRTRAGGAGRALAAAIADADSMVRAAVDRTTAGAVLLVARRGRLLHLVAYGDAERLDSSGAVLAKPRPMRPDTRFDLASVTKVMATTFACMRLVDAGRLDLDAPVSRYLADFHGPHLDSITARLLLRHASGLVPWQPLYYHASTPRETYEVIRRLPLAGGVGEARRYSDLGFMLLGYLVERVAGLPLDQFVSRELYAPLGLQRTGFAPDRSRRAEFAATEVGNGYERRMTYDTSFAFPYHGDPTTWNGWRQRVLAGETNDGNAFYANGGVAGHAGLFSTAEELRVLVELLLNDGRAGPRRLIGAATIRAFLTPEPFGHYLGWMRPTGMPEGSFMHTGFTGTYVLGVPRSGLVVILLANRQQIGADRRGHFPDLTTLREGVSRRLAAAADEDDAATLRRAP